MANTTRAAFVHSPDLERYSYPPGCPFRSERAAQLRNVLLSMGMLGVDGRGEAGFAPASRQELETFHTPEYLDALEDASRGHMDLEKLHMGIGTEDCPVFHGMYEYAALAAGGSLKAADLILAGAADVAFNPSGGYHHAHAARAGGFCYVNDVVLACLRLRELLPRVLFLDIDAHHCDGVQAAFYARRDVMTISLHETGKLLFPGTGFETEIGEGDGRGFAVNVPLPPGTYDDAYVRVFNRIVPPLVAAYDPPVIVLEMGMDCLAGDPLTHLSLTNNAYADVLRVVRSFGRPVLAVGGGGYNVENTVRGWALGWKVLCGDDQPQEDLTLGLGGVMLGSTDWEGGLRDPHRAVSDGQRREVTAELENVAGVLMKEVWPIHGM